MIYRQPGTVRKPDANPDQAKERPRPHPRKPVYVGAEPGKNDIHGPHRATLSCQKRFTYCFERIIYQIVSITAVYRLLGFHMVST